MPQPLLNSSDTARLTDCLARIEQEDDASLRWEALDQLRYFCDGADIPLLEVIGGKKFSTLAVLVQLLQLAEELGGPAALRDAPPAHRVPLGLVLRLLETLMCNATANLKPFLKTKDGVRLLIAVLARRDALVGMPDGEGLAILDHACNLLCYLTFHHPETAAAQFMAADGIAAASRVLECVRAHYARTLARPGSALPSRPPPEAPPALWDSLAADACELVANVASAHKGVGEGGGNAAGAASHEFTRSGALKSLAEMLPLLLGGRARSMEGHAFVAEQLLLAVSAVVWCAPKAANVLLEGRGIDALLNAMGALHGRLRDAERDGGTPHDGGALDSPSVASPLGGGSGGALGGGSKAALTPSQWRIYQATLLVVLNAQLENRPMQDAVAARLARTPELLAHLTALGATYYAMIDACEHIRLNHFHADEVVKALLLLSRALCSDKETPYLLLHMHGTQTLELLLRCLSNIDEEVLRHACDALYCLISRCEPARLLLLRRRGIADLAECLRDYNTAIKATSLQILCVLAAESGAARHEMRQEEVLMEVLKTVQAFPAEDVTPHVLESALEAVSHIVLECRANQDYIRNVNGLEPLVDVLEHCAKNKSRPGTAGANPPTGKTSPRPDALRLAERACLALSNVVYKNSENQQAALALGAVAQSLALLKSPAPGGAERGAVQAAALSLLVNLADTSEATQDALDDDEPAGIILGLLTASASAPIVCAACLLLSHVAWSHANNQRRYGTEASIRQLLALLSPAGRAAALGAHSSWGSERAAGAAAAGGTPTKSNGGAGGDGGDGDEAPGSGSELTLCAMLALVNLSHQQPAVQALVRVCGGLPLLQAQLASPVYETRRAASFCLGNLVKGNAANGRELVSGGGVEALLRCVNDDDDDELAKTAYSTLSQLGEPCLLQLLALVDEAVRVWSESRGGGGGGGGAPPPAITASPPAAAPPAAAPPAAAPPPMRKAPTRGSSASLRQPQLAETPPEMRAPPALPANVATSRAAPARPASAGVTPSWRQAPVAAAAPSAAPAAPPAAAHAPAAAPPTRKAPSRPPSARPGALRAPPPRREDDGADWPLDVISAAKPPAAAPPMPQPTAADDFEVEELEEAVLDWSCRRWRRRPTPRGTRRRRAPRGRR